MTRRSTERLLDEVTGAVLSAAIRVHRYAGPGLLESCYEAMMVRALINDGLTVERQRGLSLEFEGLIIPNAYFIDLVVEDRVVVELKSVESLNPVHAKQVISYLRLTGLEAGLLINFNTPLLKDGIQRFLNTRPPSV